MAIQAGTIELLDYTITGLPNIMHEQTEQLLSDIEKYGAEPELNDGQYTDANNWLNTLKVMEGQGVDVTDLKATIVEKLKISTAKIAKVSAAMAALLTFTAKTSFAAPGENPCPEGTSLVGWSGEPYLSIPFCRTVVVTPPPTNPPATNPPETTPPETNPPATNPPATNPPIPKTTQAPAPPKTTSTTSKPVEVIVPPTVTIGSKIAETTTETPTTIRSTTTKVETTVVATTSINETTTSFATTNTTTNETQPIMVANTDKNENGIQKSLLAGAGLLGMGGMLLLLRRRTQDTDKKHNLSPVEH